MGNIFHEQMREILKLRKEVMWWKAVCVGIVAVDMLVLLGWVVLS